jgi:hypothetical protein
MTRKAMSWRLRSILYLLAALAFFVLTIYTSHREYSPREPGWSHGLGWDAGLWLGLGLVFLVLGAWKPADE